jgi:hypothetical protein
MLEHILANKEVPMRGWDVARWYSACLASVRPWVRSQHQKRKNKQTKKVPMKLERFIIIFSDKNL